MAVVVLTTSTLLQYLAAFMALRLVRVTTHRAAWILVATAMLLMAVRRSITLHKLLVEHPSTLDIQAEWVALVISVLMVAGMERIAPLFAALTRSTAEATKNRQKLQSILDHTPAAVIAKDLEGRYILCNRRAADVLGKNTNEIVGRTDTDLFPLELAEAVRDNDALVVQERRPMAFEENIRAGDGAIRHYRSVKFPLLERDGSPYAICAVATDVTERIELEQRQRKLEARLAHAQKLESLGVLAGGIAHDFNNLLAIIMGNLNLAALSYPSDDRTSASLRNAMSASETAAGLCSQLLTYAGDTAITSEPVDLSEIVTGMSQLMEVSVTKKAKLETHLSASLPLVHADPTQLQQVVMNLITNASEAIGDRAGTITVSTSVVDLDHQDLQSCALGQRQSAGEYVCIEVADTGKGMDDETRHRVFEPFYTTKFTGRGLGLAAVAGIVRSHRGAIRVRSVIRAGTAFQVFFPVPEEPLTRARNARSRPNARAQNIEKILLVDDEPALRLVSQQGLESVGYRVSTAENGRDAVEKFRRAEDPFDLVVLDLTMPVMDGQEALAELRRVDPKVRVLLVSGYASPMRAEHQDSEPRDGTHFLRKPYTVDQLVDAVGAVLSGPRGTEESAAPPQAQGHDSPS